MFELILCDGRLLGVNIGQLWYNVRQVPRMTYKSTGIGHFTNIEVLLHEPFRKRPASCSEQFSVYYATVHSLYFALEYIALAYIYININYL